MTVLLCVSQKAFFLSSWPSFLNMCLGTLKVTYDPSSRIENFFNILTNNGAMSGSGLPKKKWKWMKMPVPTLIWYCLHTLKPVEYGKFYFRRLYMYIVNGSTKNQ